MAKAPYHHEHVKSAVTSICTRLLLDNPPINRDDGSAGRFVLTSVLDELIWKLSEAGPADHGGKYLRCTEWSHAALVQYKETKTTAGLVFEHVVPRAEIKKRLLAARCPGDIANALADITSCIVTKKEHDHDLTAWDETQKGNLWHRYSKVPHRSGRKPVAVIAEPTEIGEALTIRWSLFMPNPLITSNAG